jgi:phosphosulfolactate synthase (CoM biosynthesis protein A)
MPPQKFEDKNLKIQHRATLELHALRKGLHGNTTGSKVT